jgi:two-component system sensor histidine kinase RegB
MISSNTPILNTLCNLRWLAIVTQAAVAYVVTQILEISIPALQLWCAIGLLAVFNGYAIWRTRQNREVHHREIFAHIVVDVSALAWLIAWSGGIANPFTSLFLLPIAFAALALPLPWIYATTAACGLGYAMSAVFGRPLPHIHGVFRDTFDLHLWGMVVNFIISVAVVLYFLSRLAVALREREQDLSSSRERFARNEGIVALATHAASVAHELNTPLGTLTLMLDELVDQEERPDMRDDLLNMRKLVDVCRDRVRELAAPATDGDLVGGMNSMDLECVIDRWVLIRPTIQLVRTGSVAGDTRVDPAVSHLLQALFNNAADASQAAGVDRVDLRLDIDEREIVGEIRDYGAGFSEARSFLPSTMYTSDKPDGMGIGLALSHATVERMGGELSMKSCVGPGVRIGFRLPKK